MNSSEIENYDEALIHREMLKLYLDTFFMSYENVADEALDKAIAFQREVYTKHRLNLISLSKRNIKSEEEDVQTEEDKLYVKMYLHEVEAEVFALYELKIMYAYKYFEIRLKELSRNAFKDWPQRRMFKWPEIVKFYESKNIKLEELRNYLEVDQLRSMNNSLKHHDGEIEEEIKNLPEFKGITHVQVGQLKKFNERIRDTPKEFISALASTIYDQLFKNDKSTDVSKEFDIQDGELILPF